MSGGRPRRPAAEARLVREARGTSVSHDCSTVVAARIIARLVTADLASHIEAQVDPLRASMAELGRKIINSPTMALASDPSFDTASLFVEARVARLRGRAGMSLPEAEDRAERLMILKGVQVKLERRYLRYLRANK